VPVTAASFLAGVVILAIVAFGLAALGFVVGWRMESTQGFHAMMMLFLFPLWLLSGSFFPLDGAPGWLRAIMYANPLTYGVAAFRRALYGGDVPGHDLPSFGVSMGVTAGTAILIFIVALRIVGARSRGDHK